MEVKQYGTPLNLRMQFGDSPSPESAMLQKRSDMDEEESDEGLDSCVARGGTIETGPDGKKRCVFSLGKKKAPEGTGEGEPLPPGDEAKSAGILGVFRKILGM